MPDFMDSEAKITTLTIEKSSDKPSLQKGPNSSVFNRKDIRLNRGGINTVSYDEVGDLSRTLAIKIYIKEGSEKLRVQLPADMLARMAEYIRMQKIIQEGEERFDCGSFAHYVNGIPYKHKEINMENWIPSRLLDEKNLEPGNTIIITDHLGEESYRPTHMAIYLGNGLYLSKFGSEGGLIAADLEQMKKGFGGKIVFKMIPAPGAATLLQK